jgi:hypothetical protein
MFTPSSMCAICNNIIHLDPNSPTGASATRPCELWSEAQGHGFCLQARNFGSCKIFVFVRSIGQPDFPLASFPVTLTNPDGSAVLNSNGTPVTAVPFEPAAIFDSFTEVNEFQKISAEFFVAVGILCVKSSPAVCPICDVEFTLTLSCGETLFYKIAAPILANPVVMTPINIMGTVQCRVSTDVLNTKNLSAQLVACACCRACPTRVVATVPITASTTMTDQGTFEFKNVQVECFRVLIICNTTTAGANNILGASDCQLVGGSTTIMVDPISISCTACQDIMVTVTGTAVCATGPGAPTGAVTDVTVQFIRCVKNADAKCGAMGSMACGSPLMVTPTFSMALPSTGIFTASVPQDCYLVRFVCTSSPTTVLTTTPVQTCQFFCKTTTNIGTITIPCSCPSPTVTISGSVVCSPTATIPSGITALLVTCIPPAVGTACGTASTTILPIEIAVDSSGNYNFGSVNIGCYSIRFVCTSCFGVVTDIGGTACTSFTTNTVVSPVSVNCSVCSTFEVSGSIAFTCTPAPSVLLAVTHFTSGTCAPPASGVTFVTPTNNTFAFCVPSGTGVTVAVVCASSTSTVLLAAGACISTATALTLSVPNCTCP